MPKGLKRFQQAEELHFITFSCHERRPYLADATSKQTVEQILEQTRSRHEARIFAYVLMPEHVHILIDEPPGISLGMFLKSLKQETARRLKGSRDHFWMPRYYDFNVYSNEKFSEKIKYIHRNPVTRGLVPTPELYPWSSYTQYATGATGKVQIESRWLEQRQAGAPFIAL